MVIIAPESMTALGSSGEVDMDSTYVWVRISCWSSSSSYPSCTGESVAWESSLSDKREYMGERGEVRGMGGWGGMVYGRMVGSGGDGCC